VNQNGYYEVILNIEGEWQIVIVDDLFPCMKRTKKPIFSKEIIQSLQFFNWTGNVRQLKLAIEWLVITYKNNLQLDCLSYFINSSNQTNYKPFDTNSENEIFPLLDLPLKVARDEFEKIYLNYNMDKFQGNIARMSVAVDMERTALYRKLKTLVIQSDWDNKQKTGS
jgi:two-component system nitrogen regulation response regulator NtrX